MPVRNDVLVEHDGTQYISLSKLLNCGIKDILCEVTTDYLHTVEAHYIVLEDGYVLSVQSNWLEGVEMYDPQKFTRKLLSSVIAPPVEDEEDEDENEYGDDDDDDYDYPLYEEEEEEEVVY